MKTLSVDHDDGIAVVTFRREKDTNAFSRTMTLELMDVSRSLPPDVGAVVLTGGMGRSFSVGGDFNDVRALEEEPQIRGYLGEILDLYIAVLRIDVPVVAAMDKFSIGQGLQVALMTDWRVATESARLAMPELKNGVACPLGSIILEFLFGRAAMLEMVLDCDFYDAKASRSLRLVNEVVPDAELLGAAMARARRLRDYPRTSFVATKRIQNERFASALESVREPSTRAHVEAFLQKTGKKHFDTILGGGAS